jgi:hypothetical protein
MINHPEMIKEKMMHMKHELQSDLQQIKEQ